MPTSASALKLFRQIHLYIGVFIAPALLFFAFTGALQTFSLHETTQGSSYKPPAWIVTLAQLHKKQTTTVPVRKPRPAADAPKPDKASAPKAPEPPTAPPKNHTAMKAFFLLVALGLFTSTLTGLYMAYKYTGNKLVITCLLLAGIVIPLILTRF
jgi:uncharacterized iron-regulated membrane protein